MAIGLDRRNFFPSMIDVVKYREVGVTNHLVSLLQIPDMLIQVLQGNLAEQRLMPLPQVVLHLRVHVVNLRISPASQHA